MLLCFDRGEEEEGKHQESDHSLGSLCLPVSDTTLDSKREEGRELRG